MVSKLILKKTILYTSIKLDAVMTVNKVFFIQASSRIV